MLNEFADRTAVPVPKIRLWLPDSEVGLSCICNAGIAVDPDEGRKVKIGVEFDSFGIIRRVDPLPL